MTVGRFVVTVVVVALACTGFAEKAPESALANVERRTAEVLKIDRSQIGEWDGERGRIVVVGIAAREGLKPAEIIGRRHEFAQIALMDAKLQLAEKLGFSLSAEEKRQLWGDSEKDTAGVTTKSSIQFLAKHRIYGGAILLQSESLLEGEYVMAVSLIWTKGLEKSAQTIMSGRGKAMANRPGKHSLDEWLMKVNDPALIVGPRQYVDNKGQRHFIGVISMPYDEKAPAGTRLMQERMLKMKASALVAWALRADVATSSASLTMLQQTSVNGEERVEVASELVQRVRMSFRGATPPVKPLFEDGCIYRSHPLFPGVTLVIYACELDGEFLGDAISNEEL